MALNVTCNYGYQDVTRHFYLTCQLESIAARLVGVKAILSTIDRRKSCL